jgi:hypothetical protein
MAFRILRVSGAIATALAIVTTPTLAHAIGYWNVPGNFCQCWGYGWGAGHHACLTLGPVSHEGLCAHNQVRLPYAPQPPHACYGDPGYNFDFRQPAHAVTYGHPIPAVEQPINHSHPQLPPDAHELPVPQEYQGNAPPLAVPDVQPDSLPLPDESQSDMPEVSNELFGPPVEP